MRVEQTIDDPGTLDQIAQKNFEKVFDAFLKRGISGMKDEVVFITEDAIEWNKDKQLFEKQLQQKIRMSAKRVVKKTAKKVAKKAKKTTVVKRRKAR